MGIPDPERDPQFYDGVPMRRLVAFCIDTVIIIGLWIVGAIALSILTLGIGVVLIPPLFFVTVFGYRWFLVSRQSATFGMKVTGIELRDPTGAHLDSTQAAIHTAAFMASIGFLPIAIVGWILMASSPTRQAIHDLPLGTVAINRPD